MALRPDFLPGDGSVDAIRSEHEENKTRDVKMVNPFTFARVDLLLNEIDRMIVQHNFVMSELLIRHNDRVSELLTANNREVERRREAERLGGVK